MGRSQGPLESTSDAAFNWAAAAFVFGAWPGCRAGDSAVRRVNGLPRSDLGATHRESFAVAQGEVHYRTGDAHAAPGTPSRRPRGGFVAGWTYLTRSCRPW